MNEQVLNDRGSDEDEISLLDLLQVLVDNLRLLLGGTLLVGVLAAGVSMLLTPVYTAKSQILPPREQQSATSAILGSLGALAGISSGARLKNPAEQYIVFLKSRTVIDAIIDRFQLQRRYELTSLEKTRKRLETNINITAGKDGVIRIEVDDVDPKMAAEISNAFPDELQNLLSRLAVTEAQLRRRFFEKQLSESKERLIKAEIALKATGVNPSVLKSSPAAAVADVAKLKATITALEIKLASMRGYLAEGAPEIRQGLNELAAVRSQLHKLEQNQTVEPMRGDSDYIGRYREFKYQETLFELFAKQFEVAKIDEGREGALVQVLDKALPPEYKSKPKRALIVVISMLAAFFGLLLYAFVRQSLRKASADAATQPKIEAIKQSWRRAWRRDAKA